VRVHRLLAKSNLLVGCKQRDQTVVVCLF